MSFRLPIIGVVGSHIDSHKELAEPLGELIAKAGFHLLTGGGGGIMTSVAKGFTRIEARKGVSIGILPIKERGEIDELPNYTNPYIEIPIVTELHDRAVNGSDTPLALNSVNILSSDIVIALPGLKGTQRETSMALICEKPVIMFGPKGEFLDFPSDALVVEEPKEVLAFIKHTLLRSA